MSEGEHILVVDDERSMQEFLEIFFRREGYDVTCAGDFDTARVAVESDEFDVMISDIQLAEHDGLELLRCVKDVSPETVAIMITAFATTETAITAMKEGAVDYLGKPFDKGELLMVVAKAMEQPVAPHRTPAASAGFGR